mgnify:CR=1 FL=1
MRKAEVLELAILGTLEDGPAHGYELRKRLTASLGALQAISFGSLYPALQSLVRAGAIAEEGPAAEPGRRSKIAYRITEEGSRRFQSALATAGPDAWDDEGFRVRFAFFARAEHGTRRTILEGRRMTLAERAALMRDSMTRTRERVDAYTLELQRHGLDGIEYEMRWLDTLLHAEGER